LPDASVIIAAYELDVWNALLQETDVAVTSIIAHDEAQFFDSKIDAVPASINLTALINQGVIPEISASVSDIERVRTVFDKELNLDLHDGEVEAIAIIYADESDSFLFCTSDKVAIRVLAMLGLSDNGISFEEVLESIGLRKSLPPEYRKEYFERYTRDRPIASKGKDSPTSSRGMANPCLFTSSRDVDPISVCSLRDHCMRPRNSLGISSRL